MKQDPNPRHRRITLRILELAYGPGLTPEARECLAREFFRNFVLFAWETLELLLGLLGDSSGGRPAPPRWRPDGRHLMVIFPAPFPWRRRARPSRTTRDTWKSRVGPSRPGCGPNRPSGFGCTGDGRTNFFAESPMPQLRQDPTSKEWGIFVESVRRDPTMSTRPAVHRPN